MAARGVLATLLLVLAAFGLPVGLSLVPSLPSARIACPIGTYCYPGGTPPPTPPPSGGTTTTASGPHPIFNVTGLAKQYAPMLRGLSAMLSLIAAVIVAAYVPLGESRIIVAGLLGLAAILFLAGVIF